MERPLRSTLLPYTTLFRSVPSVLINITRQISSNTVQVANEVAAEVVQLQSVLPQGTHLTPFYDQSELVRDAIFIGLVLACIILFLFLNDWSSALVAGLVIPATVAVTILFLWVIGQSFNLMTLGGLAAAIGLVIDDAIVVVENIVVHRDQGQSRMEAVRLAIREISTPLVFSTITPVVVFLPLIATSGVTGSFFRALAITMTAALLTSLALAVTFTPALSLSLLHGHKPRKATGPGKPLLAFLSRGRKKDSPTLFAEETPAAPERPAGTGEGHADDEAGPVMRRILETHARALNWALARPLALLLVCGALVVATYFGYNALGSDLLPAMDEGAFILDYFTPAGTSLAETNRILTHVEQILHTTPEVTITPRRTGMQLGLAAVTEARSEEHTSELQSLRHLV